MAVISIFSGPFCQGKGVAEAVTERTGYRRIDDEVLAEASSRSGVAVEKLQKAMTREPSFLDRLSHDRELLVAHVRLALAEALQEDNLLQYGFMARLIPKSMNHVLRVCLIANLEYRVQRAVEQTGGGRKQAEELVNKGDRSRAQWSRFAVGRSPYEPRDFDLLLPMHEMDVEQAAGEILVNAGKDAVRTTPESKQAAADFLLAARVNLMLAEKGHQVRVFAEDGHVTIAINKYTSRLEALQRQLNKLAKEVEGVRSAKSVPGTGFVPPSLVPTPDLPSKVLLVDDEKEFVHSLSERLQTRHFNSSVVYDGEQALDFLDRDEPDVMVLDLKMPGIDGIEVLRNVKRDHPNVEVIILTGHGSDREEKLARELGAFAYLTKPVDIELLSDTMKAAYQKVEKDRDDVDDDG